MLLGKYEGITFPSEEIPSIIGFEGITDGNGIHIGYKMNPNENRLMKSDETKAYYWEIPADISAGNHLIFLYTNIIEYQYVVDTMVPLLRVIDSKQRLKNGSVCELEPTHRIIFTNLDYKKLLINTIQSISIELRRNATISSVFGNWKSYSNTLIRKVFPIKWIFTMLIKRRLCPLLTLSTKRKWFWHFSCKNWTCCTAPSTSFHFANC